MNNQILLAVGIALTLRGFYKTMDRKSSGLALSNRQQIISTIMYPGGFLLVFLSNNNYVFNLLAILVLNFFLYPIIWGITEGISTNKRNREFMHKERIIRSK